MMFVGRKDTVLVRRTVAFIKKTFHKKYQSSWHIAHDSTRHGLGIFATLQTRQYEN